MFCALVFVVMFRAHVQLRILTPLLDWKRCSSSQSSSFSGISTKFQQVLCVFCNEILFQQILIDTFLRLVRDLIALSLLAACSVAIRLVHENVNLYLSWEIDQCRMLSRLSLDFTEIFATAGYTLYFVSAVL